MAEAAYAEIGYTPHAFQQQIHLRMRRRSVVVAHRRFGKTVLAINTLISDAIKNTNVAPRYGYIAPFRIQAKQIAWDYLKRFTENIRGAVPNESDLSVDFEHNGARIRLYGADRPDAIRGIYFDGVVLDEVAQMRPFVWGEIIRPMLIDRLGWSLFIGTPKGINLLSELWQRALSSPDWYAGMFRASETGLISDEELESVKEEISDTEYKQEFECDFQASAADVLFPLELVLKAVQRNLSKDKYQFAAKIISVDVARYGNDRSCIFRRQGLAHFEPVIIPDIDNMALAGRTAYEIDEWGGVDACFIDMGRGEGVFDRLVQMNRTPTGINFGGKSANPRYANKRSEMWANCSKALEAGAALPNNEELIADLVAPTYSYANARNKFELEEKEKIKARLGRSPDVGDACCMCHAIPVVPRERGPGERPQHRAVVDYDPYAGM